MALRMTISIALFSNRPTVAYNHSAVVAPYNRSHSNLLDNQNLLDYRCPRNHVCYPYTDIDAHNLLGKDSDFKI